MEIFSSNNPEVRAGKALTMLLKASYDAPVLLLVSGGSAFKLLESVEIDSLSEHCTLGVLDERYSIDPEVNNFAQLTRSTFYSGALSQGIQIIDTRVAQDETMEEVQARWDTLLHEWNERNPNGVVIVTMGVGKDGHIAGILPSVDTTLFEGNAWTCGYEVPKSVNPHTKRLTVTHTFLRTVVTHAIVFVVGEDKEQALQAVLREKGAIQETPARIVREISVVSLYTDRKV